METYQFSFEKPDIWHKSRGWIVKVYLHTKNFPDEEKFGLTSQMRRAAVSVTANIAERSSRFSKKDQSHFYQIAYSSLMELLSHFFVAFDLGYLQEDVINSIKSEIAPISRMLNSLYHST